jgi:hypothetical protein
VNFSLINQQYKAIWPKFCGVFGIADNKITFARGCGQAVGKLLGVEYGFALPE